MPKKQRGVRKKSKEKPIAVLVSERVSWFVYFAECADGSIYTGISNNVEERILAHNTGKGAKYTKSRRPVVLRAFWPFDSKSEAAKAEYAFKQLPRNHKLRLITEFGLKAF
jgi:putative endonuclease